MTVYVHRKEHIAVVNEVSSGNESQLLSPYSHLNARVIRECGHAMHVYSFTLFHQVAKLGTKRRVRT